MPPSRQVVQLVVIATVVVCTNIYSYTYGRRDVTYAIHTSSRTADGGGGVPGRAAVEAGGRPPALGQSHTDGQQAEDDDGGPEREEVEEDPVELNGPPLMGNLPAGPHGPPEANVPAEANGAHDGVDREEKSGGEMEGIQQKEAKDTLSAEPQGEDSKKQGGAVQDKEEHANERKQASTFTLPPGMKLIDTVPGLVEANKPAALNNTAKEMTEKVAGTTASSVDGTTNAIGGSSKGLAMASASDVPAVRVAGVECAALTREAATHSAVVDAERHQQEHKRQLLGSAEMLRRLSDCGRFRAERGYMMRPVSEEEAVFPLAYSLVVYTEEEQVERLLRAIYRPQNFYAFHVDSKAKQEFKDVITALAACFPNVFVTSTHVDVQWGKFSQLDAELANMRTLWGAPWKYLINLTGQEFPLKTNLQIVRILKLFNGANSVHWTLRINKERTKFHHDNGRRTNITKEPNPLGLRIVKGEIHLIAQLGYVDFVLHDNRSAAFLSWLNDTAHPDETYYATLNVNPQLGIPGTYTGNLTSDDEENNPFVGRYKIWWDRHKKCYGSYSKSICIFGIGDLQLLAHRHELFANKFYYREQPLVYDCLEEWFFNRTRQDVEDPAGAGVDEAFYLGLDFVKHHL